MQGPSALAASQAVEGAFVFGAYNIAATLNTGPAAAARAGLHGVAMGRFAWVEVDGVALNARLSPEGMQGLVMFEFGPGVDWRRVFFDDVSQTWRIREGLSVSLLARGSVWARFPFGAIPAQPVYANILDGSAISGYSASGELTPWSVVTEAAAGELAIITTWNKRT
jgi:hypothetical protein